MLQVPEVVRNRAVAAGATAWLDALPELIATLEREWTINIGDAYEAATEAFVAEASLGSRGASACRSARASSALIGSPKW